MKASRKADLGALLKQMQRVADAFASAARTLGVEALVDLANRTLVYVEACATRLQQDEDFSEWRPQGELWNRLHATEAELAAERARHGKTLETCDRLRERIEVLEPLERDFRAQAYRVVQDDLQRNRLWVATESGDWLPTTESRTLQDAVAYMLAARRAAARAEARPAAHQPVPTLTHSPQDFRAPSEPPRRPSSIPPPPAMPTFELPAPSAPEPDPSPSPSPDPAPDTGSGDWSGGGGGFDGGGASGDW